MAYYDSSAACASDGCIDRIMRSGCTCQQAPAANVILPELVDTRSIQDQCIHMCVVGALAACTGSLPCENTIL